MQNLLLVTLLLPAAAAILTGLGRAQARWWALAGIALAWLFYVARPDMAESLAKRARLLYVLSHRKFFIDEIYAALIVRPLEMLAALLALVDKYLVDGIVDAVGALPRALGAMFRPLQSGLVQFYALVMALGVLALVGALLW